MTTQSDRLDALELKVTSLESDLLRSATHLLVLKAAFRVLAVTLLDTHQNKIEAHLLLTKLVEGCGNDFGLSDEITDKVREQIERIQSDCDEHSKKI